MARDVFTEDFEDKTEGEYRGDPFSSKKISTTLVEKGGWIMAAVIMLVVVFVMTSDIKLVGWREIGELSLSVFVLLFLSYSMYGNMYHNGMLSAKRLDVVKETNNRYIALRDEVKDKDVQKDLARFCKEYVDNEWKTQREGRLERADVSWGEYQKNKNLSKKEMRRKKLPEAKIKAILDANWIVPIKLTPRMIYRTGGHGVRVRPLHTAPSTRRTFDMVWNLAKTSVTSLLMCFMAFEVFSEPTWETMCAVAIKLLTVALNGYAGYRRGYDNIAVDTVNYTEDQIDMLEQFKKWREPQIEVVFENRGENLLTDAKEVAI
jgi:hypothetical protein